MLERPPLLDKQYITQSWAEWFSRAWIVISCINDSGTTVNRPTKNLFVGRRYIDIDLGLPIWVLSYSAGSAVWIDAAGNVV